MLFYIICGSTAERRFTPTIHRMLPFARLLFGLLEKYDVTFHVTEIVSIKVKGRISKRLFQENKARQIFLKMNISYPLIRPRTYEICPFALLPTRLAIYNLSPNTSQQKTILYVGC